MMELNVLWFVLITVLFTGFFFLEGFDYGVGGLAPFMGRTDEERGMIIRTIGPVWDGNEVWMITAGGALFAAFPHVYSTMFSTFYLALFLMLVALILRGVAFELRGKADCLCWRRFWEGCIAFGSIVPAFLWGVAVTNLIAGLPINNEMHYLGSFYDLLSAYTIVGGFTFLTVFLFHGAAFLTQRLGDYGLVLRARDFALKTGAAAIFFFVLCFVLTATKTDLFHSFPAALLMVLTGVLFIAGYISMGQGKFRGSFICSSLAIVAVSCSFFTGLFPRLMVSSINPAFSLTIENASSTPYTLSIMTVAALVLVPIVLIYQGWCYWVFRHRVTGKDLGNH